MIDLHTLRENPQIVRRSQELRGNDPNLVDEILTADEKRRTTLVAYENLRAEQNALSKLVGKADPEKRTALLVKAKELAQVVKQALTVATQANEDFENMVRKINNIVLPEVPAGGEDDYEVIKQVGVKRDFIAEGITIKDHIDVAEGLDILDMKRGTKVSGSRFYYLKGMGARLELAMLTCAADIAIKNGFNLMVTPTLVYPDIMAGTGFIGEHADEIYHLSTDDLYLVGTSEVALAGYHKDEIIDLSQGPLRYAGWSSCYRREAGSYGKDTRGIIRVHQFNKVEMFSYARLEDSEAEHRKILALEEEMLSKVELPYRVINVAAGDLGSSAAQKFDCEAWLPSQNRWMEVTSTSNCTTYQARRLHIREKRENGTQIVATLNGTLATTRWLVAMLENHQQADGSLYIPQGLRPYLGGMEIIEPVHK